MNAHIERMAREASNVGSAEELTGDAVERFARLIAEDCAKIADGAMSEKDCWLVGGAIRERYK